MCNKQGFTLLEMMIMLVLISTFLVVFPFFFQREGTYLMAQLQNLKQELLQGQLQAIQEKKSVVIYFHDSYVSIGERKFHLEHQMHCTGKAYQYGANGNVSFAQSVSCAIQDKQRKLVIQLGSGQIDIR